MLQVLPGKEVIDDVVVHVATGPREDKVARPKSNLLQQTSEFSWSDDWHVAGLAIVNDELMSRLIAPRSPDLPLKFVDRHGEFEPMVHDCLPRHQIRNVDRQVVAIALALQVRKLGIDDPDFELVTCL